MTLSLHVHAHPDGSVSTHFMENRHRTNTTFSWKPVCFTATVLKACKNVSNCITTVCTSLSDITCSQWTCSWEDRWCWPGNCGNSNYAKDCQCESPSFTTVVDDNQSVCQLAKVPEVLTFRMTVIDTNNDALMSHVQSNSSSHCSNQGYFYGNLQVDRIVTNTSFELLVNVSHLPKPAYVTNHAFGVTNVDISVVIKPIFGKLNKCALRTAKNNNIVSHMCMFYLLDYDVSHNLPDIQ
ncbi:uncharacterized protein [Argopecten irradians]|uniref:uncharacterized protein n=1 Tax=Argopecten irradians TaxID=31199 RepID=UPI0037227700